ncbi:hypothetical protein [Providencia hangzhouensis]
MELFVFKVVITPLLLLTASLAARRWGESIGGLIVGLPLTSGPISFFLALEYGTEFATQATLGSLSATAAQACFAVVFYFLVAYGCCKALIIATLTFSVTAYILQVSQLSQSMLFIIDILIMMIAMIFIPNVPVNFKKLSPPRWDLPARMLLIAVVGVTLIAPFIGAGASGVLASHPFMASILAVFSYIMINAQAAQRVMRGLVAGLFSFAVFFYSLSLVLPKFNLFAAYTIAIICALIVQFISLRYIQRVPKKN